MTMHKKKILNSNPLLFLSVLCIVIIIFLTSPVNVHAATTYTLPYNINDYEGNSMFWEYFYDVFHACETYWNTSSYFSSDNAFYVIDEVRESTVYFMVFNNYEILDTSSIASIYANQVTVKSLGNRGFIRVQADNNNGVLSNFQVAGWNDSGYTYNIFGGYNITTNYGLTYQRYYPVFTNTDIYDVSGNLVIYEYSPWLPEDEVLEDFHEALDITSTLSNGIDNTLTDIQNQKGFFDNLVSNLKNFFNSLNGWINNGFTFLSSTIKTFFGPLLRNIQNYLSLFKGSFEDFKDHFSNFFQIIASIYNLGLKNGEFDLPTLVVGLIVPDVDQLSGIIRSSVLGAIVFSLSTFSANTVNFVQSWFNTTPVYIYHIPDFTFHGQTISGLYFDFSWYSTYKPYGDAIISFWLVINYGMFLLRFVPRFLRSAGSGYSEGSDIVDFYDHGDRDDGSYYFENGMRAPSMFDFM